MKASVLYSAVGLVGGFIAMAFGGWSDALITLMIFMSVIQLLNKSGEFRKIFQEA